MSFGAVALALAKPVKLKLFVEELIWFALAGQMITLFARRWALVKLSS